MNKILFVTNAIGSDNWVQIFLNGGLVYEGESNSDKIETFAEALHEGFEIEIEYVTDEEMAEYSE